MDAIFNAAAAELLKSDALAHLVTLNEDLVVHGRARVEEGGARDFLQRLAHVYLGPDAVFPPPAFMAPGYVTRIEPESLGGVGSWAA